MIATVLITLIIVLLALLYFGVTIYMVYLLYQEKGIGHAILGFFVQIYSYVWGWLNAGRLKIADVMVLWTFSFVMLWTFPFVTTTIMTARAATQAIADNTVVTTNSDGSTRITVGHENRTEAWQGNFPMGETVTANIDPSMAHGWTFDGTAGQEVKLIFRTVEGGEIAPTIQLYESSGALVRVLFGSGEVSTTYTLPADDTYTVSISGQSSGTYYLLLR